MNGLPGNLHTTDEKIWKEEVVELISVVIPCLFSLSDPEIIHLVCPPILIFKGSHPIGYSSRPGRFINVGAPGSTVNEMVQPRNCPGSRAYHNTWSSEVPGWGLTITRTVAETKKRAPRASWGPLEGDFGDHHFIPEN